jgi:hypothetical protein
MNIFIKVYALLLSLYPRPFRSRFGIEMLEVFSEGVSEARAQKNLAGFLWNEAVRLPQSLASAYLWTVSRGAQAQMALSGAGGGEVRAPAQRESWRDTFLAALPHLLTALIIGVPALLEGFQVQAPVFIRSGSTIFLLLFFAGALGYSLWKGWRRWSATWLTYLIFLPVALVGMLINTLLDSWVLSNIVGTIVIPLVIAFLLYTIVSRNRSWLLLSALPVMNIVWIFFAENAPPLFLGLAYLFAWLLSFACAMLIFREKRFERGLLYSLVCAGAAGLPFVILAVYRGGTLPYTEPGPSLRVVLNQWAPMLAGASTLVLGPPLALKARELGRSCAQPGGKHSYRLALSGVLLGLLAALVHHFTLANSGLGRLESVFGTVFILASAAGTVLYLAGYGLLVFSAIRSGDISGDDRAGLRLALLFLALPGVPLVLLNAVPGLGLMGYSYGTDWLIIAVMAAWMAISCWLAVEK